MSVTGEYKEDWENGIGEGGTGIGSFVGGAVMTSWEFSQRVVVVLSL